MNGRQEMFDQDTAALISSTPELEGLDRQSLPDLLTNAFAQIAAARVRLRAGDESLPDDLEEILQTTRRLASTNEALVSLLPEREDRSAAAFVAATAHQLSLNAYSLRGDEPQESYLLPRAISSDVAALLLFLVAEATSDAAEVARAIQPDASDPIIDALIHGLLDMAEGRLSALLERSMPSIDAIATGDLAEAGSLALYFELLRGVHALARQLLSGGETAESESAISIFRRVRTLCIGGDVAVFDGEAERSTSTFSGPHHLASLLIAVASDLTDSAVANIPPPSGIDPQKWGESMQRVAKARPYLWRNHREAIKQGYLEPGTSSAVGFPTGAGKSTLSELKINAALLGGKSVIFLCPTHALVDQTARNLGKTFPTASVKGERLDEFGFATGDVELLEIFVMTPEACLAQLSIDSSIFEDVGLLVFDECHLLHPNDKPNDRRAIDAMLCLLIIPRIAPQIDFLLLSAMMKNTDDIAEWITELTGRPCLPLSLAWKPTRQLRGSVIYQQSEVDDLDSLLRRSKRGRTTKNPPVAVKRELGAYPLALFSLKQTWATSKRADYTLVRLLNDKVLLSASNYWRLTPNAVAVSSAIAAAAVQSNVKVLVFFQTIKNAASAANQISDQLEAVSVKLTDEEAGWADVAVLELGDESHLYNKIDNGRVTAAAAVHHGLLLPEERLLCESLYKRRNGIKVLAATSTLAQGMNLPSELVLIGEDSRFDEATDKKEILKAQELLNAAGRAGRAGEGGSGIVLVIPGKVVGIDLEESTIGAHWTELREVFGQSDQCLSIDDPLTAVLDRVHAGISDTHEIDSYALSRLASGADRSEQASNLETAIGRSFAGFLARKREDSDWLEKRIDAAKQSFGGDAPETEAELVQSQVAASLGLPLEVVRRLSSALQLSSPGREATVPMWRKWFFCWLSENPDLLEQIFRPETLAELFGRKRYASLETVEEKSSLVLPVLAKLVWLWMRGEPLRELELALGTDPTKLKTCDGARRFVLRVVPEFAFLFGLPALLHERAQVGLENPEPMGAAQSQLGRCVRYGFNFHEKAALHQLMRKARFSRRQLHRQYTHVKNFLARRTLGETWEEALLRVEQATDDELAARR
jgi:superfamily II DNA/RNA helicase